ncbi:MULTISPECIES: hypothetical protein [unclassified Pseudomonas]|nr:MULTISPECIES: hypothetical protein [unclassified Pseudomonas]MDX9672223.1 hypothetical protein [Pseudomonas sp. P8_250]PMQ13322.1 hypothetical protein PseAD21_04460 [Pseudomonas sp. AD21]WPN33823.1 hypothetical protein QMK53_16580 [Pseudomonas sp. P8_139]WPN38991.1 hypothetical protein QMK55_14795 [Pseudomonas sp. P8_229]
MPHTLKLTVALLISALVLGGCMQIPDDLPLLATLAPAHPGPSA